jgi:hypothetical protein
VLERQFFFFDCIRGQHLFLGGTWAMMSGRPGERKRYEIKQQPFGGAHSASASSSSIIVSSASGGGLIQKQTQGRQGNTRGIFLGGLYIALSFRHIPCSFPQRVFRECGSQDIYHQHWDIKSKHKKEVEGRLHHRGKLMISGGRLRAEVVTLLHSVRVFAVTFYSIPN